MGKQAERVWKSCVRPAWVFVVCALASTCGYAAGPEPLDDLSPSAEQGASLSRGDDVAIQSSVHAESRSLGPAPARPSAAVERSPASPSVESGLAVEARAIAALLAVIGIAITLAWLLKRGAQAKGGLRASLGPGGASPAGVLRVLGRYPIARGQTLVLLQMDQTVLLVAQTYGRGTASLSTLSEVTDPDRVASLLMKARESEGESVSQKFKVLMERLNSEPAERAITVVPPVEKGDWYERGDRTASRSASRAASRSTDQPSSAISDRQAEDAVLALKRRLEAMRQGGGVSA